jgi:biopolymer transport protein ExbD
LDKLPKTYEQLKSELISQAAKNPKLVLAINADEKAPWGKVVKIRDAAAEAKITSLVAYTKEKATP